MLSVVLPTLNAADRLPAALAPLVDGVLRGLVKEVIVVDGGSQDATIAIAEEAGATIVRSAPETSARLAAGAAAARGGAYLFLDPDTRLSPGWVDEAGGFLSGPQGRTRAAAFAFALDDDTAAARAVAAWVDLRCAVFGLPYGDQGLLISRALYDDIGGYRPLPRMADVDLVRRLGRRRIRVLRTRAVTSAAGYRGGVAQACARDLGLIMGLAFGGDPARLTRAGA
ncbi:MAG: glycosyltransferase [Alphaproteobacteria bacterium]|nr:glycosyltransferase [Alphaproteobacteria bacterium]